MTRMLPFILVAFCTSHSAKAFDFSRWKAKTLETSSTTKTQRIRLKSDTKIMGMAKIRTDSTELKGAADFYRSQKPFYQSNDQKVYEQNGQFHILLFRQSQPYAIVQVYGQKRFTPRQLRDFRREMTRVPQPAFATVVSPSS